MTRVPTNAVVARILVASDLAGHVSHGVHQLPRLLREVDSKLLSVSLKGASEDLQAVFFAAMSSRASEMLRDDMEASGPIRLADVEAAQKDILEIAMRLESEGGILLPRGGGDGMV